MSHQIAHLSRVCAPTASAPPPSQPANLAGACEVLRQIGRRTALVIDLSNITRGAQARGVRLDYDLALRHTTGRTCLRALVAASLPPEPRPAQVAFYGFLQSLGCVVETHPLIVDPITGRFREDEKAVDGAVRAAIRAAADTGEVDSIVLFGGDGGYTSAVTSARRAGVSVFVLAWSNTLHPALAQTATASVILDDLLPLIGRVVH